MLFEHQRTGAAWLAGRSRGYLGDEPGLGKSRTVLTAMAAAGVDWPLIVCPAIVKSHWHAEAKVLGVFPDMVVKSYEEMTRGGIPLMKLLLGTFGIDALGLDEAHYLKHATSQRTLLLLGREGYARRIPRVYCASGTPIPRNPSEFWTVGAALFPEIMVKYRFANQSQFEDAFCVKRGQFVRGAWRDKIVGTKNDEQFRELLGQCMLRRTLEQVGLDVPALFYQPLALDAPAVYDTTDDMRVRGLLDNGVSLEAIATDPHLARYRRHVGELKAQAVVELLRAEIAETNEQVVVFAHHRSVLNLLRDRLEALGLGVSYIDGNTTEARRAEAISAFRARAHHVFLGQNIACGTGMDGLQGTCKRVILVEPDWTATLNEQLAKRVARLGSRAERVVVQFVSLSGTLDDAIVRQNVREAKMQSKMFA